MWKFWGGHEPLYLAAPFHLDKDLQRFYSTFFYSEVVKKKKLLEKRCNPPRHPTPLLWLIPCLEGGGKQQRWFSYRNQLRGGFLFQLPDGLVSMRDGSVFTQTLCGGKYSENTSFFHLWNMLGSLLFLCVFVHTGLNTQHVHIREDTGRCVFTYNSHLLNFTLLLRLPF